MVIAVLGAGNVGRTLAQGWARRGHTLRFGSRREGAEPVGGIPVLPHAQAIAGADVIVNALPAEGVEPVLSGLDLAGHILVDTANALRPGFGGLVYEGDTSFGEKVAEWAPGAKVVKAFNTIGYKHMADPIFGEEVASMLVAGDDPEAKKLVMRLANDLGFDAVDAGPLTQSRGLEQLALLWISMALVHGVGENMAFRVIRK